MPDRPAEVFFRDQKRMYPWLIGAAILFAGAYMLALYTSFPGWAVLAFVAGLVVGALGVKLIRQPAARLSGHMLTLSDPRGLSLGTRAYALDQIKRVSIETRRQSVPNRLRRGVLMVNLTGVPAERIEAFVHELRERDVQVDNPF
ncbi:MAG TPA: hypothetical protein VFL45_04145 [Gammaproteobacteria bacterium]|nr:hypothetical protein [Gammaproteobacteria bacterium]